VGEASVRLQEPPRDPWRLLTACIFLTKTTAKVALPILETYFSRWSGPQVPLAQPRPPAPEILMALAMATIRCKIPGHNLPVQAAGTADEEELCELLRPMGLQRLRSRMLTRFSREYLQPWSSPARDLHGIGKYGEDAWRMFCCGDMTGVRPADRKLVTYLGWWRAGGGQNRL
jgi:hypothetical protein